MDLVLGRGASKRQRGAFVPWEQKNMLLEPTATDPNQYNLLSMPPLAAFYVGWGSGPVHGVFQRNGLFGGSVFAVIGTKLYRDGVDKGTINGSGPVRWAAGFDELVLTRGQTAYSYNGTGNAAAISFPDGADVRDVAWLARQFYFVRKGSGRFYWSDVDDGRTIQGDSFANAESNQDELLAIAKQGDGLWMLGYESGEFWILTGDNTLPLSKVPQRYLSRGVQDTGCAEEIEGTVYFIASDGMVCRIEENAVRVSDASLDEKIRQSATGSTFHFAYEGKPLFCMRLDSGTWALDLAAGNMPVELGTYGRTNWAPKCAINVGSEVLLGDDTTNIIWTLDPDSETDCGLEQFERLFTIGLPVNEASVNISNVIVRGDHGDTLALPGTDAADPTLEMRYSRDGGRTWSDWRGTKWGATGAYQRKARFGSCGAFGPPGFLAQCRMLECAPLRVSRAGANESMAGRSNGL